MITSLLKHAYSMDVELWTENGKLKYKAPEGALTVLKQDIVDNKGSLIMRLEQNEAAKIEQWVVFEFGEMYSKTLGFRTELCIFRNEDETFTVWRGGWKTGESRPSWQKTMVGNAPFQEAFNEANSYMNWSKKKPAKGGTRKW